MSLKSVKFRTRNAGITITLEKEPFAGGGEGNLYKIVSPANMRKFVAKLYHKHKLSPKREEKINFLLDNPPHDAVRAQNNYSPVTWVTDTVYQGKDFKGFLMPFMSGDKLEILCTGKLSRRIGKGWERFSFKNKKAMDYRLRVCFNLAAAIYQIHSSDRYVLVDLKPDNVVIKPNGLVSIVDTDSVEVLDERGNAIFVAPVATPEYTPPEFYVKKRKKGETVGEPWDRFGLAVIFYKLLFGIHPFASTSHPPYAQLTSLHEKIQHGLFVHSESMKKYMKVVPPPHKAWERLPENLRQTFIQCFENGHKSPELRPTAEEWCVQLLNSFGDEKMKQQFGKLLFRHSHVPTKVLELPSKKVNLPEVKLKREDWIPQTVSASFSLTAPTLAPKIPNLDMPEQGAGPWINLGLSWVLFALVFAVTVFALPQVWDWLTGDMWQMTAAFSIAVILGIVAIPQFILPAILEKYPLIKGNTAKGIATQKAMELKKMYSDLSDKFNQTQNKFAKLVTNKLPKFNDFESEVKNVVTSLKTFLMDQDNEVRKIYKEEQDKIFKITKKYMEKVQNDSFIKQFKGHNLEELRERVELEQQSQISAYKLKLNIKDDLTETTIFQTELKKLEKEYTADKNISVELFKKEKKELEKNYITEKKALENAAGHEANIELSAANYLKMEAADRQKIVAHFIKEGFTSMSQVDKIDILGSKVVLKDGKEINVGAVSDSPFSVCSLLTSWFSSVQHKFSSINPALEKLEKKYQQALKNWETNKKFDLKKLDEQLEQDKEALKIEVMDVYYKTNIGDALRKYEDAKTILDELLKEQEAELLAVDKNYAPKYEKILTLCDKESGQAKERIEILENRHKTQLDSLTKSPEYQKFDKEIKVEIGKIETTVKEYQTVEQELIK